jgi:uncharacterized protein YoaH (UPF0181 family)
VIEGATTEDGEPVAAGDVATRLRDRMADGLSKKDAIARVAAELDVPKKEVYKVAVDEGL